MSKILRNIQYMWLPALDGRYVRIHPGIFDLMFFTLYKGKVWTQRPLRIPGLRDVNGFLEYDCRVWVYEQDSA